VEIRQQEVGLFSQLTIISNSALSAKHRTIEIASFNSTAVHCFAKRHMYDTVKLSLVHC